MKLLITLSLLLPLSAMASCPENLIGRWEQTKFKMKAADNWQDYSGPYWEYQSNGKVKVMMGIEHPYSCDKNIITVDTPLKTTFEILKQDTKKIEVKVNNGEYGFFVIEKKS